MPSWKDDIYKNRRKSIKHSKGVLTFITEEQIDENIRLSILRSKSTGNVDIAVYRKGLISPSVFGINTAPKEYKVMSERLLKENIKKFGPSESTGRISPKYSKKLIQQYFHRPSESDRDRLRINGIVLLGDGYIFKSNPFIYFNDANGTFAIHKDMRPNERNKISYYEWVGDEDDGKWVYRPDSMADEVM